MGSSPEAHSCCRCLALWLRSTQRPTACGVGRKMRHLQAKSCCRSMTRPTGRSGSSGPARSSASIGTTATQTRHCSRRSVWRCSTLHDSGQVSGARRGLRTRHVDERGGAARGPLVGSSVSTSRPRCSSPPANDSPLPVPTTWSLLLVDAQVHPFDPRSFDAVISQFGAMFFEDPQAAFANLARALRPDGRLVFVCWQHPATSQWVSIAFRRVPAPFSNGPPAWDVRRAQPVRLRQRRPAGSRCSPTRFRAVTLDTVTRRCESVLTPLTQRRS